MTALNETHNPGLKSWLPVSTDSDFPIQNLPLGLMQLASGETHAVTRIGETVIDLYELMASGYAGPLKWEWNAHLFSGTSLNGFIALGKQTAHLLRKGLQTLFAEGSPFQRQAEADAAKLFVPAKQANMILPIHVGDYTDFYSSIEHATNVGVMFRGAENALMPNWKHLPVGYHGRASSIVVSGTDIRRPRGQMRPDDNAPPVYGPSRQLDFELEMAFVIGKENPLGYPVGVQDAEEYIYGMMLFNDWSARDIQKWEYVPLGPFLGKNFASSVSPWIVTMEALEPFRVAGPAQDPQPLEYLRTSKPGNFDIALEVSIELPEGGLSVVSQSNFKYMYWNMSQQLAHHTVNGCNMRVGDMCASGTISGPEQGSFGSMLEIAWKGTRPVPMPDGSQRVFIQDGDSVVMRGHCVKDGLRIGFGEVRGKVLPALFSGSI